MGPKHQVTSLLDGYAFFLALTVHHGRGIYALSQYGFDNSEDLKELGI